MKSTNKLIIRYRKLTAWNLTLFIFCFILLILPTLSSAYTVGVESASRKVLRGETVVAASEAYITAARNEFESFQILLAGGDYSGVRLSFSDLISDDGDAIITAENFEWHVVGYVETTEAGRYGGTPGWYPDPLVPGGPFNVSAGEIQPVWVTVYVPFGTPAGEYRGHIDITPAGPGSSLPVRLRVWDFDLPVTSSVRSWAIINGWNFNTVYGAKVGSESYHLGYNRMSELLLKYRLGPGCSEPGSGLTEGWHTKNSAIWPFGSSWDFTRTDEYLDTYISQGLNSFSMMWVPSNQKIDIYDENWQNPLRDFISAYIAHLDAKDPTLMDKAFILGFDEPWTYEDLLEMEEMQAFFHDIDPRLKVLVPINWPDDGGFKPASAERVLGSMDIVDLSISSINDYQSDIIRERDQNGKEIWVNCCVWPWEHPNVFTEYPAIDARMFGWIVWAFGLQGFEYWGVNYYPDGKSEWPTLSNLNPAWLTGKNANKYGDGYLVYPGRDANGDPQPIPSIRLANIREGFEDYEYMKTLQDLVDELRVTDPGNPLISESEALLSIGTPIFDDAQIHCQRFTDNPQLLEDHRAAVANKIEMIRGTTTYAKNHLRDSSNKLTIFPAADRCVIRRGNYSTLKSARYTLNIYNTTGTLVKQLNEIDGEFIWNTSAVCNGIYLMKLVGNQNYPGQKFLLIK